MTERFVEVKTLLDNFNTKLMKADARKEEFISQLEEKTKECAKLKEENDALSKTLHLLEQCNIAARDFVKVEVEQLVTQGLRSIFENPSIQFNIDFVTKRNQIEAEFTLSHEKDGKQIQGDILTTYGGGVVDVISFSLRVIIMQLMKIGGPIILDEPGKMISAQFIGAFGKFLTEVSKTFNRQIIMITHNHKLAEFAKNSIEVYQMNNVAHVKQEEIIDERQN